MLEAFTMKRFIFPLLFVMLIALTACKPAAAPVSAPSVKPDQLLDLEQIFLGNYPLEQLGEPNEIKQDGGVKTLSYDGLLVTLFEKSEQEHFISDVEATSPRFLGPRGTKVGDPVDMVKEKLAEHTGLSLVDEGPDYLVYAANEEPVNFIFVHKDGKVISIIISSGV